MWFLQAIICRHWYFSIFGVVCGWHAVPARILAYITAECWLLSIPADNTGPFKYFSARMDEFNSLLYIGVDVAIPVESDRV